MVKSDIKKFNTYKEEIEFCKGIFLCLNNKVLLIGSNQFKQDILEDKKEIKLSSKEKYSICLCEEDYIEQLKNYTKKIKGNILIVKNEEQFELTLQLKYPSMNNDIQNKSKNNIDNDFSSNHNKNYVNNNKCKQDCNECNQEDSFEEQLADFIEEYAEVIEANPDNIRNILYEFYNEVYSASHLQGKMDVFNYLSEDIQNNVDEINNNYYGNENNGYKN